MQASGDRHHTASRARWLVAGMAAVTLACAASNAVAAAKYEKHADGLAVYLDIVPVEVLRGPGYVASMHAGLPGGKDTHHVPVSVFDDRSGRRIDDALVNASVGPLELGETRRGLQPMVIANFTTYGNFFPMAGSGPYVERVTIRQPRHETPVRVQFN